MASYDMMVVGNYLSAMVKGKLSQEDFRQITDEMLELCEKNDIHKVIIDVVGTAGSFTKEDSAQFAVYASETLKYAVKKYAYVFPHELLTYNSQKVAQGRGLFVRAFYNFDDALAWIEKD